ncbi:uncharacterized protein LOC103721871 [Phoenix dactylifera]|uniref:allantoinase n=1 Tax=Phoenix dactylifera TaxID=42345 RepID=A0A8B8ZCX7_PHODC|nr:uncharacterized protein LOC103721871 [Phoenix dactylifera]
MGILGWRALSLLALLASILVLYIKTPSEQSEINSDCSLLPYDHYWISSKRIVTPQGVITGAVEVKGGIIVSVVQGDYLQSSFSRARVVDYGDAVIMPGLIDVHAHLDEPGRVEWEGFYSGTKAAAAGGITTLIDMPLNSFPSTVSEETLRLKVEAAEKKIYVDVGFWGGLVPENAFNTSALQGLLNAGALGLKSFMCPSGINDFPMTNSTHIKEGLYVLAKYSRPLLIHAEIVLDSETKVEMNDGGSDARSYATYLKTRPPSWEEAAIRELQEAMQDTKFGGRAEGAHVHIVHLSDAEASLDLIKDAKRSGASVSVETCPHYLAFAAEEITDGDTRFKCAPPIRDAANRQKLWEALMEQHIDMLSSDHSPSIPDLKLFDEGDFLKAWGGISSLQFVLPVAWSYGQKYGITFSQLVTWWSERPAKLSGQNHKGALVGGNHADLVVWEPEAEFELDENHKTYHKHPTISPYMGKRLSGKVLATFVRGNLVYSTGKHAPAACGVPILAKYTSSRDWAREVADHDGGIGGGSVKAAVVVDEIGVDAIRIIDDGPSGIARAAKRELAGRTIYRHDDAASGINDGVGREDGLQEGAAAEALGSVKPFHSEGRRDRKGDLGVGERVDEVHVELAVDGDEPAAGGAADPAVEELGDVETEGAAVGEGEEDEVAVQGVVGLVEGEHPGALEGGPGGAAGGGPGLADDGEAEIMFDCFIPVKKLSILFFPSDFTISATHNSRVSVLASIRASNLPGNKIGSSSIGTGIRVSNASQEKAESFGLSNDFQKPRNEARVSEVLREELRKETEKTLEWSLICSQVSAFVCTSAGKALCRSGSLPIGRDREESLKLLDQTAAAVLLPQPLDFSGIDDVSEIVRSAVDGQLLTIGELCAVERSLRSARRVFEQLEQIWAAGESPDRFSPLLDILQDCDFLTEIANKIRFCIDCTLSIVLDRASMKLESLRLERKQNMERLESLLRKISMEVFQVGGIDRPLITKRRSRMCIGIRASHKSLLPEGIVLSSSSSGATYFMEPRDAVVLNNMEVRLLNDEKDEELAILSYLSSEIARSETKFRLLMEKILELDLASARGAYALWMNGVHPLFSEGHQIINSNISANSLSIDIQGIQHPLLLQPSLRSLSSTSIPEAGSSEMLSRRDRAMESEDLPKAETPVPIDIRIGYTTKVLVISGPNTGGKTATMKTLGLAALMSKAGMFLPARGRPRLPWFDQILADIGDHQTLEHNLSTFSGHISRICKIIEVVSKDSLVLIDEIGSGTDPSEGVALSTSILQHLAGRVNLAVVTTHYADLSRLKDHNSQFENAAMEFCVESLQPTYRILWGSTGNSNALSIAKSIGFDQKVLDRAQEWVEKLVPDKQKERQGLLYQSLLEERNLLEAQSKEAASVLSEAKKLHLEIRSEAEDLDKHVAALKAKESQRVQQELKTVKSQMDSIIKNFETQLKNASPYQFKSMMREAEAAIASIVAAHHPGDDTLFGKTDSHSSYIPQIGDKVYVKGLGNKLATVIEAPAEDDITMVQYGKIKVRVKKTDVKLVEGSMDDTEYSASHLRVQDQGRYYKEPSVGANKDEVSFGPAVRTSKNTVDLRGMRVEEASHHLHMAISGCRSYGVLFVVHGVGTGAVKKCAVDILRNHPRVAKFEEEGPMNYGCTIAYIK